MAIIDLGNVKGPQGIQGIQGIQGEKGEKGDKGDTGATGAAGQSVAYTNQTTSETGTFTNVVLSTTDLTAGTSALDSGTLYFVYE